MMFEHCEPHGQPEDTCDACLAEDVHAMNWRALERDLAELEAVDPVVRATREECDRGVRELLRQQKSADPQGSARPAWHAPRDDDP